MKISVIGCGYLGAVHAASMAKLGHEVVGVDVDERKIEMLASGQAPFFEPGLPEILEPAVASGRLTFTTDVSRVEGAKAHFVGVGTPQKEGEYAADLRYVDSAFETLIPYLHEGDVVVGKSTVPVGTAARLQAQLDEKATGATLIWNPEFLREGFAVKDTLEPDRIIYGLPEGERGTAARATLDEIYAAALSTNTPLVVTDFATAELVKVAANAFLATKISFINAISELSDVVGADITHLADAIGYDVRIGRKFLNAGVGFGGGCLPKDVRAFRARAEELGASDSLAFLKEIDAINTRQRSRVVQIVIKALGGPVKVFGKKVAVLGLAFKPHSDDVRDSPSLDIAVQLKGLGADVYSSDPQAIENARRLHPQLHYVAKASDALADANVVVLLTEWPEYRDLDPVATAELVGKDRIIVDGRNVLDPIQWRAAGWTYVGLGRP